MRMRMGSGGGSLLRRAPFCLRCFFGKQPGLVVLFFFWGGGGFRKGGAALCPSPRAALGGAQGLKWGGPANAAPKRAAGSGEAQPGGAGWLCPPPNNPAGLGGGQSAHKSTNPGGVWFCLGAVTWWEQGLGGSRQKGGTRRAWGVSGQGRGGPAGTACQAGGALSPFLGLGTPAPPADLARGNPKITRLGVLCLTPILPSPSPGVSRGPPDPCKPPCPSPSLTSVVSHHPEHRGAGAPQTPPNPPIWGRGEWGPPSLLRGFGEGARHPPLERGGRCPRGCAVGTG